MHRRDESSSKIIEPPIHRHRILAGVVFLRGRISFDPVIPLQYCGVNNIMSVVEACHFLQKFVVM